MTAYHPHLYHKTKHRCVYVLTLFVKNLFSEFFYLWILFLKFWVFFDLLEQINYLQSFGCSIVDLSIDIAGLPTHLYIVYLDINFGEFHQFLPFFIQRVLLPSQHDSLKNLFEFDNMGILDIFVFFWEVSLPYTQVLPWVDFQKFTK